ncbi:hypothetical protein KAR48_17320 [bacterium]|nr:hypothetical protein [bacterium]
MQNLLWIEDDVKRGLASLAGPIYASFCYKLDIALNATQGITKILSKEYDAVVLDIRIPPGTDKRFRNMYSESNLNKNQARLGIEILHALFDPGNSSYKITKPDWVSAAKFGILSVETENEVMPELKKYNISHYQNKSTKLSENSLLELFEKILNQNDGI